MSPLHGPQECTPGILLRGGLGRQERSPQIATALNAMFTVE